MLRKSSLISLLVILLLTACGGAAAPAATPTSATPVLSGGEVKIDMSGFKFSPETVTIKVGQTVTWTNQDSATHDVAAKDGSWQSPSLAKGKSFSRTFETAGTYLYVCTFHSGMKGTIIVEP